MKMTPPSNRRMDDIATPGSHRIRSFRRALAIAALTTVLCASTAGARAASADSALDAYEKRDFARARAEFEKLAKERPDDPRYRFNAGDAAYRMRDFTNAAAHFESALTSPDLKLQQGAYYNLGNSRYLIGEQAKEPQAKLQAWQQSLTNFSSALGLDPKDTNAASNLAYMRQRVEELMKQMPPPQKQQPKGDKDKDKKDKKDDPGKDQQPPQQQSGDKPQDPQDQQKDDPGKDQDKDQAGKKGEQEDKKSGQAKSDPKKDGKPEQGQKEKQQAQKQDGKETGKVGEDGEAQEASEETAKPGEMSPAQAARLLDNQKAEEKALVFQSGNGKESPEQKRRRKTW